MDELESIVGEVALEGESQVCVNMKLREVQELCSSQGRGGSNGILLYR